MAAAMRSAWMSSVTLSPANIHTFNQWFNTAAFALPGMNDPGSAGKYDVRQPGVNNNDMALAKSFPIKSEKRQLSLRWEAYKRLQSHAVRDHQRCRHGSRRKGRQTNTLFGTVSRRERLV